MDPRREKVSIKSIPETRSFYKSRDGPDIHIYDAVHVFASALDSLDQSQEEVTVEPLHCEVRELSVTCDGDVNSRERKPGSTATLS